MTYEQRFLKRADSDAQGFAQAVQQRYGFTPAGVTALLKMASTLSQPSGAMLSDADVQTLKNLHPQVHPGDIDSMVDGLHKVAPGARAQAFLGALAEDRAVLSGDMVNASPRFKEIDGLVDSYVTNEYAEAIDKRRGGTEAQPWRPEPGSVRALLEQATESKPQRQLMDAMNAGNPYAEGIVREQVAQGIEGAIERLQQPEASTRETLDAAWDMHTGSEIAADQFGIGDNE